MKIELHCHSMYSHDALSTPASFARAAKHKGLGAIALTDHNTTRGWSAVKHAVEAQGLAFIPGEEIKVYDGPKCAGEIIGLFLNEQIPAGQLDDVLDSIRKQDALAFVAHPFDWMRHPFPLLADYAKKVDAIEILNARCVLADMNRKARSFAEKNHVDGFGGSDAHVPEEIGTAWIETNADSAENLRQKMKKGDYSVHGTTSPFWVHFYSTLRKKGFFSPR